MEKKNEDLIFLPLPVPNLGVFYIKKVLFHYIYPRIFVCEKNIGKGLFLFAKMSNENNIDVWLTAKISEDEYNSLINREMSIQDAYFNKVGNDIFTVSYDYTNEKFSYSFDVDKWLNELPKEKVYVGVKNI